MQNFLISQVMTETKIIHCLIFSTEVQFPYRQSTLIFIMFHCDFHFVWISLITDLYFKNRNHSIPKVCSWNLLHFIHNMHNNTAHTPGLNMCSDSSIPFRCEWNLWKFEITLRWRAPLNRCLNIQRTTFSLNVAPWHKSEVTTAQFEFCHVPRVELYPDGRYNVRRWRFVFFSTRKNPSGKFRLRLRNYGGKNAGIPTKQCEISEECFSWQLVGMIRGGGRAAKQRFSILRVDR